MPVGVPEKIRARLAHFPRSGAFCEQSLPLFMGNVRVQKIAQQFLSSCAAAEWGNALCPFSGAPTGIDRVPKIKNSAILIERQSNLTNQP